MQKTNYTIEDFLNIKSSIGASLNASSTKVAYLSNLTGSMQIYSSPVHGGEAKQLTDYDQSVGFAVYSPVDDNIILFSKDSHGDENHQLYLLNTDTLEVTTLTDEPKSRHTFGGWSRDAKLIAYSSNKRNGKDLDIYVLNLETGGTTCVFDKGGYNLSFGVSPKQNYVVVATMKSNANNDLFLVDLRTNKAELITKHTDTALSHSPKWLPDESGFYFVSNQDSDLSHLRFYNIKAKSHTVVCSRPYEIEAISLSRDGQLLGLFINQDGYSKTEMLDAKTLSPAPCNLPGGTVTSTYWAPDNNLLAFGLCGARQNSDVWIWDRAKDTYWQVTHSPMGVDSDILVEPELIKHESFDGLAIPAFVYMPPGASKPPAVVHIHGGPEAQARPDGLSPIIQYLVYKGYAVIAPNVRGSTGYGKHYMSLDNIEKRMDSVKDIVALHAYAQKTGLVDSKRMALMGGSYGGFMTLAGLAFYPKLWAAGVDVVGIANFVTFLENTAPLRRGVREAEYGSLENHRDLLEAISPINKVDSITAPLFIIHGTNDSRVPLSEAHQIADGLKKHGRQVELLVYEDEGHGLSKLKNRLDAYPKVVAFLDKALK